MPGPCLLRIEVSCFSSSVWRCLCIPRERFGKWKSCPRFERTEDLGVTQFSQVTSVMRVRYLDEEEAVT